MSEQVSSGDYLECLGTLGKPSVLGWTTDVTDLTMVEVPGAKRHFQDKMQTN